MKIATINYTYGGDIVNLSFWNKQNEVLQELNLSRDPIKRSEQIKKYIHRYK